MKGDDEGLADDGDSTERPTPMGLATNAHTSPYPVSRLSPAFGLVDMAQEIERADTMLGAVVTGQLEVISEQIRALQEQAKALLEQARQDALLHRARCSFTKRPGGVYHLYEGTDGAPFFSLLGPHEWTRSPPHRFIGSYRLEIDASFTPVGPDTSPGHAKTPRRLLGKP
jgi:hypothetical protein